MATEQHIEHQTEVEGSTLSELFANILAILPDGIDPSWISYHGKNWVRTNHAATVKWKTPWPPEEAK